MIKVLLFDLGGVIIDLDLEKCLEHFRRELGYAEIVNLLDKSNQRGIYSKMEEGVLSADEFRQQIISGSRPGVTFHDVDLAVESLLCGIDPRKPALFDHLSDIYPVYMLSNNNPISMPKCREIMAACGMDEKKIFTREFLSCEMHLLKPSHEIYARVIDSIMDEVGGISASEILFVDDSKVNIEAAAAAGLSTLHYAQGDDLEKRLKEAIAFYDSQCNNSMVEKGELC